MTALVASTKAMPRMRKHHPMRIRRLATSLLLVGVAVVSGAVPALAHTELQGITPADGEILAVAPTAVTLAFAASVSRPADPIQISGPGGIRWVVGTATTAGPVVTAPVEAAGPAGAYTLAYAVISDDGDTVDGTVTFSLVSAATPTTPTTAPSSTSPRTLPPRPRLRRIPRQRPTSPAARLQGTTKTEVAGCLPGCGRSSSRWQSSPSWSRARS